MLILAVSSKTEAYDFILKYTKIKAQRNPYRMILIRISIIPEYCRYWSYDRCFHGD